MSETALSVIILVSAGGGMFVGYALAALQGCKTSRSQRENNYPPPVRVSPSNLRRIGGAGVAMRCRH